MSLPERVDVAIAGGGVIGMACAEALSRRGLAVAVFERGEFGRAASWAGGGMLCRCRPTTVRRPCVRCSTRASRCIRPGAGACSASPASIPSTGFAAPTIFRATGGSSNIRRWLRCATRDCSARWPRPCAAAASCSRRRPKVQGWIESGGAVRGVHTARGDVARRTAVLAAGAWSAPLGVGPAKGQTLLAASCRACASAPTST